MQKEMIVFLYIFLSLVLLFTAEELLYLFIKGYNQGFRRYCQRNVSWLTLEENAYTYYNNHIFTCGVVAELSAAAILFIAICQW